MSELLKRLRAEPPADQVKAIRDLERQLAASKAALKVEAAKRAQAEAELGDTAAAYDAMLASQSPENVQKLEAIRKSHDGHGSAILCFNDWHSEANIDPAVINGINEFNLDIAEKRIHTAFRNCLMLVEMYRSWSNISELVVWLGGDLINGYIHEECQEGNFLGPAEAQVWVQRRCREGIDLLLSETDLPIRVFTSHGNHGRSTKRVRPATDYRSSWEFGAFEHLADTYLGNDRIGFRIEKGYLNWADIQGHHVRFHHGHFIKYAGGVGGIPIPVNKAISQWNKIRPAALDIFGHFHQSIRCPRWVACNCLCGYDPFALSIKAEPSEPSQTFIIMDRKRGKVLDSEVFCN